MVADDTRTQERARFLREKMEDRGLNAPALGRLMAIYGEKVSDDYLRKLARGYSDLSAASLSIREALRKALKIPASEWEAETGLITGTPTDTDSLPTRTPVSAAFTAKAKGYRIPKQALPPIPDTLIDAGIIYGDRPGMEGLKEYRWQRTMERLPHRRRPQTPEEWLALYLDLREKLDPPEPEE